MRVPVILCTQAEQKSSDDKNDDAFLLGSEDQFLSQVNETLLRFQLRTSRVCHFRIRNDRKLPLMYSW